MIDFTSMPSLSEQISKIADELEMHALFDSDTAPAFEKVTVPVDEQIASLPVSEQLTRVAEALQQEIEIYQQTKGQ